MGLEKIISSINEEAALEEQNILSAAKEKADKIMQEAQINADEEYQNIVAAANKRCEQNLVNAECANTALDAKALLSAKVEAIYEVIGQLKETVLKLPDNEYFDFIKRLVKRYAENENGVVIFGKKDAARVPEGFLQSLNAEVKYPVTFSDKTADFDNGFILKFGDIEENCSIDALISDMQDSLKDKIAEKLFGE
ncbi:MAG: hypothetical protein KBS52_07360 [Clostridiales bacterium]|nr:hypothetical protein [Candidatus Equinaster intestinalis]